ncbi:hypothetical protein F5878DRAFT_729394 [Lentinula raphanica]|uniref:DUF6535 domain-containing protein n=1 Tax=Lentinula raphanica TaxID=153919 RepID=A0AA38NX83_9AGAR|nr:hypothetical protein F5878DRAFT_729394 [Lentinula raphanica]
MPSVDNLENDTMDSEGHLNSQSNVLKLLQAILHESQKNCEEARLYESKMLEVMQTILQECHKKNEATKMPTLGEVHDEEQTEAAPAAPTVMHKGSPQPLGQKQCLHTNPAAATYDYRLKYPVEDEQYHEHDAEARVWWVYNDEAKAFDDDMVGELGEGLDVLLIFAGLFSAVITTFIAQTSQALSVDNTSLSVSFDKTITAILQANGNSSIISQIPATDTSFSPATGDIWVNGLWFTSLTIALSIALFAVLAKQWLRQYTSFVTGTSQERACIRQFRLNGLKKWKVPEIIGIFPILLHFSVMLFLTGLIIFLFPLNTQIAYVILGLTITTVLLYIAVTIVPFCIIQCPYRTTFSEFLYYIYHIPQIAYRKLKHWQQNSILMTISPSTT